MLRAAGTIACMSVRTRARDTYGASSPSSIEPEFPANTLRAVRARIDVLADDVRKERIGINLFPDDQASASSFCHRILQSVARQRALTYTRKFTPMRLAPKLTQVEGIPIHDSRTAMRCLLARVRRGM